MVWRAIALPIENVGREAYTAFKTLHTTSDRHRGVE
jgi:hypothetical protein